MSEPRILRRPPQGWDRRPNSQLGDLLMLVALLFAGACFFNWSAQAFGMILEAAGLS